MKGMMSELKSRLVSKGGKGPVKAKLFLPQILVSILLIGLFLSFLYHIDRRHVSVIDDINNQRAIVLSPDCNDTSLSEIIFNNNYAFSAADADFIAAVLVERQKEGRLPSLFTLQKRAFGQVPAAMAADSGVLAMRLHLSCENLGQNAKRFDTVSLYRRDSTHCGKIVVYVLRQDTISPQRKVPCEGVPVRLISHFRDSLKHVHSDALGYRWTDSRGMAAFDNLDVTLSYSVLPIRKGFEYGASKGTFDGRWRMDKSGAMEFSFEEKEHRIPLFDDATLRRIKTEKTILVRSPQEFKAIVVRWFAYVMLVWWGLCLYMVVRRKKFDGALVASGMFLTVLCVLMMFSMQDPLNDELNGVTMGKGVVTGVIACLIFQSIDFIKFYQNNSKVGFDIPLNLFRWFFRPYRQKVAGLANTLKSDAGTLKKMLALILVVLSLPFLILDLLQITRLGKFVDRICEKLPKGIGWFVVALLLTALLWTPFGQSIGGMRVNLNLFGIKFQPSEIAKYLILLFMAAFFTHQADIIIAYSQPHRMNMIGSKVKTLTWIILGLAVLMAMYLVLGDMGPGLVIGITFVLLYSLVKSKVNLENLDEEGRWKRIFTCDFAMLIYGVLTFAGFLLMGYQLGGKTMMLLLGIAWFVLWVTVGFFGFKKQLFESPLLINAVIFVFVFGGDLMQQVPGLRDSSAVERFNDRVEMCTNVWGDLDIEHLGENARDVSNDQVANGLWAMATGGMWGQGLGESKPSLIPAFHTDMILSSIGEQLGWMGLLLLLVALAVLLRKMAVVGYRVGHPFAFYLCLGFAVVMGVQFFIIALGSSGIIPLTGVTVPFLSFGRVSMILNLAAFGVVLSLCNNIRKDETAVSENVRRKSVEQYSYPMAMVTMVFLLFAVSTLLVWQYYQLWRRDNTLIHPAYVINNQGVPVVEYNPRINLLERNMYAGRIRDRKGVLLATSDRSEVNIDSVIDILGCKEKEQDSVRQTLEGKLSRNTKRYYPLGEHLFFMVGDNVPFSYSYNETYPMGFFADDKYLSYLRGFDNVLYDNSHNPIKVVLSTDRYRESSFLAVVDTFSDAITIRDYTPLLKYLKDGIDGEEVKRHNEEVKQGNYDLHLTVDAALQVDLQNRIADYMVKTFKKWKDFNLMRTSVVILDAENGDLLASANYPLPNYDTIYSKMDRPYSDNFRDKNWQAYTDRDLGTAFMKAPGSTAKVMSAMAGLRKDSGLSKKEYYITTENAVEGDKDYMGNVIKAGEPADRYVSMHDAIVQSSNCYFINLVNDQNLYMDLETIYAAVGVRIGDVTPYYYTMREESLWKPKYHEIIVKDSTAALRKYRRFTDNGCKGSMHEGEWLWAWGQGFEHFELEASPLAMARVAATVVNGGKMPVAQYVREESLRSDSTIQLLTTKEALVLKGFMQDESKKHSALKEWNGIGGKTGTAERPIKRRGKNGGEYSEDVNDCWYMCFMERNSRRFAVVVRIERAGKGQGHFAAQTAVPLVGNVVLKSLNNYLENN